MLALWHLWCHPRFKPLAVILNYCASGCIPRGAFFVRILLLMGARRMKGGFILFNFGGVVVVIKMCLNFLFMNHQVVNKKRRVVVVGAGFAGLNFVKHIDKRYFAQVEIERCAVSYGGGETY